MKVEAFKRLIKEAVREVIREEFPGLLNSTPPVTEFTNLSTTFDTEVGSNFTTVNEMLEMTRKNMTNEDYKQIVNANSSMVSGLSNPIQDMRAGGVEVGIDINNLDFVKKAASILELSQQKTLERTGR